MTKSKEVIAHVGNTGCSKSQTKTIPIQLKKAWKAVRKIHPNGGKESNFNQMRKHFINTYKGNEKWNG